MFSLRQRLKSAMAIALGTLSVATAFSGCSTSGKVPDYISFPNLQQVGLRKVWERQVVMASKERLENAWRVGDSIYVATNRARLIRIEASSGVKLWDVTVGEGNSPFHCPTETADGKHLIVASNTQLLGVDKVSGQVIGSRHMNFLVTTDPIVIGTTLCVGANDYFYGFYVDELGGQIWRTVSPKDEFVSQPVVAGSTVVIASRKGNLWRVNSGNGDWIWKDRKTNGEVTGGLAADKRAVYVPSLDHNFYAFDLARGSELWDVRLDGGSLDQTPVALKGQVLVPATGKGLYSVSTDQGLVQWESDGIGQLSAVDGDHVWAGDAAGNLKAVSLATGEVVSSTPITGVEKFLWSDDHWVIMLNKAGVLEGYLPDR